MRPAKNMYSLESHQCMRVFYLSQNAELVEQICFWLNKYEPEMEYFIHHISV